MDVNLSVEVLRGEREEAGCVLGREQLRTMYMVLPTPLLVRALPRAGHPRAPPEPSRRAAAELPPGSPKERVNAEAVKPRIPFPTLSWSQMLL